VNTLLSFHPREEVVGTVVNYLLGKPTRANRKKTIKTKVLVSERMVAPEAA
jgi:hypothetical protein